MPRLSLYRENKTNDYQFIDRTVREMYTVGGLDIYIHKYLGPKTVGDSADRDNNDVTRPVYDSSDPLFIEDLLFLENRDRAYDEDIYRLRAVYNVQDIDFDLSQFGLFLNGDTVFITFHYNDMIDALGRKLMTGDVLELPNTIEDFLSTKNKNIEINNAILQQAEVEVPASGYDNTGFYITPTQDGEPVNAVEVGDGDSHAVDAHTPQSNGYLVGYLTGNSIAPNGLNVTPGVSFPANPSVGEYALRLDYFPNRLFRFDGVRWVKIEDAVRTDLTPGSITNRTLRSGFVNNIANINTIDRGNISSRQSLSDLLKPTKDN